MLYSSKCVVVLFKMGSRKKTACVTFVSHDFMLLQISADARKHENQFSFWNFAEWCYFQWVIANFLWHQTYSKMYARGMRRLPRSNSQCRGHWSVSGYSQHLGYDPTKKYVCLLLILMEYSLIYGLDKLGHAGFVVFTVCCFHQLIV